MFTKFSDFLNEKAKNIIEIPKIENTKNYFHGGNLDDYSDTVSHRNGRFEYGAGLYLTNSYDVVLKYHKGSRKLYIVTVENGVDIADSKIDKDKVENFINEYVSKAKRADIFKRLEKYTENNLVDADVFNNILLNSKGIKASDTGELRKFLVRCGIDYEMVNNPFGYGDKMCVLYNMKKMHSYIQIKSTDTLESYDKL